MDLFFVCYCQDRETCIGTPLNLIDDLVAHFVFSDYFTRSDAPDYNV